MNRSNQLLSDLVSSRTYSKYIPHLERREIFEETINRVMTQHLEKFPKLSREITKAFSKVHDLQVLPSMRSLENNTPIPTPDGWKTVGEIKVGDVIFDQDGNPTKVLALQKFYNKDLYDVKFTGNAQLTACGEHLWVTSTLDDRAKQNITTRVINTLDIKETLLQKSGNKRHGGKYTHKYNHVVWNPKPLNLPARDLPLDPYILGLWLGDGYSASGQFACDVKDEEIRASYSKAGFKAHKVSNNPHLYGTYDLTSVLNKMGQLNNKHIPSEYLRASFEQRLALVQGLMDTDGCAASDGRSSFAQVREHIVEGFCELLGSLGIKYVKSFTPAHDNIQKIYNIAFWTSLPVHRLSRKLKRLRTEQSQRTMHRAIVDVVPVGKGDSTCFTVDSPSHTYLAGKEMIVTHNTLQFSGPAIEKNNARSYNCSYTSISYTRAFSEVLFLLLSGTGVGFSVQKHHISQLPKLKMPMDESRFLIPDTIEGWAQALETLVQAYFYGAVRPLFDYSLIRAKGSRLVTSGSKAPGPEALRLMLQEVENKFRTGVGRQLRPLEAHDIICLVSEAVLAGGVRRSALISFFDRDDKDLLTCKAGSWWEKYPYRARANNSAVLPRKEVTKEEFMHIFKLCEDSNAGEPGFFWTSDENLEMAGNPCMEISLNPMQMCNLSTINLTTVKDEKDFLARVHSATLLGTLQAAYTDFHYLNDNWRKTTEKEALLGVSMTGIADVPGLLTPDLLKKGALFAKEINDKYAKKLGINPAARITSIKPEGTASCVLGSSSGVHARKSPYYIRRFQISKNDALYDYLLHKMPNLVEDYKMALNTAVVSIPQESPQGSISENDESATDLFERVNMLNEHWIAPGHRSGANKHNVSCTLSIKPDEWKNVADMAWKTRNLYTGISCLPFDGGTYQQAPFEGITKETFEEMSKLVPDLDLREVHEVENNTNLVETQACGGNSCEIKTI